MNLNTQIALIILLLCQIGFSQDQQLFVSNNVSEIDSLYLKYPNATEIYVLSPDSPAPLCKEIYKFTNLEILICQGGITDIPVGISELSNLKVLAFKFCLFETLPDEIIKLTKLERLDLMHSKITVLPSKIGKLSNLTKLLIGETSITSLPRSITSLKKLEHLSFCIRNFNKPPYFIKKMTWLKTVEINICGAMPYSDYWTKQTFSDYKTWLTPKLPNTTVY